MFGVERHNIEDGEVEEESTSPEALENPADIVAATVEIEAKEGALPLESVAGPESRGRFPELSGAEVRGKVLEVWAKIIERVNEPNDPYLERLKEVTNADEAASLTNELLQYMKSMDLDIKNSSDLEELWGMPDFLTGVAAWITGKLSQTAGYGGEILSTQISSGYKDLIDKTFESLGFDKEQTDDFLSAYWTFSGSSSREVSAAELNDAHAVALWQNLKSIIELEKTCKGSARVLREKYGIRHFSRYSIGRLIKQATGQVSNNPNVSVTAVSDRSGGFGNLEGELSVIEGEDPTVVIEGNSLFEIGRRIVRIAKENGSIGQLMITAHGQEDRMRLGDGGRMPGGVRRHKHFSPRNK